MSDRGISHLQRRLHQHASQRGLELHLLDSVAAAPGLLQRILPGAGLAVVADELTSQLAGRDLAAALGADLLLIPPRADGAVVAGRHEADALCSQLQTIGATAAIAVGAGTINDLTKFACSQLGVPAAVVATAPSMNGYTSACAALLDGGVKLSVECRPPHLTILPLDLLCQAPPRMMAAGFADLRSRPVSGADWYLGHRLLATPYNDEALLLVAEADDLAMAALDGLTRRTPDAVAHLSCGLVLSGLAMDIAGTSAPSSGGEHLVSHYLDMMHFACGGRHDLHGCQVGVATLAMAQLYERLLALDARDLIAATLPPWETTQSDLAAHFGPLWSSVQPVARQVHGDAAGRADRIAQLQHQWPATANQLRSLLGPQPSSPANLQAAGAPTRFSDLGVSPQAARNALLYARYVRARYTVLDLVADLGRLEAWVDEILTPIPAGCTP